MRFGYLTWFDNQNVKCDCGHTFPFHLSRLKAKERICCKQPSCQYSKPVTKHSRYNEYLKSENKTMRFWHWLEVN